MTFRLTGLSTGTLYNVSVTAVDTSGNESACSTPASAVAKIDFAVVPTSTVNFGSVNVGGFADQVFTVSNTGGGTVSGSVSTSAPFSVVSGSPFSLVGLGATKAVTVRFSPTTAATATANVNFTAGGGTISRNVTGTGTGSGPDTTPPTVTIASPTSDSTYTTSSSPLTLGGTASDNVGVTQVTWTNSTNSTSGTATGTTSWTATGIALQLGTNELTVTARDAAGNTATDSVTVTLNAAGPPAAPTSLTATVASTGRVDLAWTDNAVNEDSYHIERCQGAGCTSFAVIATVAANTTAYTDTGLAVATTYQYRVRAHNDNGESYSNTAIATTAQTVTLSPIADTYVSAASPAANFGTQTSVNVDGSPIECAYVKFDLSGLAGNTIVSATLRLKIVNPSLSTIVVKGVEDSTWGETTMTYDNRPPAAGAVTTFVPGTATQLDVNITSAVQAKAGQLMTLALDSVGVDGFYFSSRETVDKPVLTVVTATPSGTLTFTDDPLIAQSTPIKLAHIAELRAAIDSVRVARGLAPFAWTDPTLTPGSTTVKAVHFSELRTALNQAYQAAGRALPTYTDPTLTAGQTAVKAAHLSELRTAVGAL